MRWTNKNSRRRSLKGTRDQKIRRRQGEKETKKGKRKTLAATHVSIKPSGYLRARREL